jgi:pimeloyl-ACP methyl ester carboxylesterase
MVTDTTDLDRWTGLGQPFLLLSGEVTWDPMPATMRALAAAAPIAKHMVLAGQSHFATHTAPQQFADAVLSYLSDS